MAIIKVAIERNGSGNIDAIGFTGKQCNLADKIVELLSGAPVRDQQILETKPEYHQRAEARAEERYE